MTTVKGELLFTPKTASELHFGKYDPAMRTNMYKEVIDVLKKSPEVKNSKEGTAAIF
jgi:hypothetical protein